MATIVELVRQLQETYPGYWQTLSSQQRDRVRALASTAKHFPAFAAAVQGLKSFTDWQSQGQVPPEETPLPSTLGELADIPDFPTLTPPPEETVPIQQTEIYGVLQQFLEDNQLPASLMAFITSAITQKMSVHQIVAELRQTPEYKEAYPENDLRRERGLSWMPEAEIRAYRNEARRITELYLGVNPANDEIAHLIQRGTSLAEWEHRLQVNQLVKRWGGAVQAVFEQEIGAPLSDERLHAFFDPDINTPKLQQIYARALERGQPALVGFGVRPEEEAQLLEAYGLDPNQIFQNYLKVAGELPRFERLSAIGGFLERQTEDVFGDVSVSGSLLFRAIQLGDPEAIGELQRRSAAEAVRFQASGGPSRNVRGGLAGLQVR